MDEKDTLKKNHKNTDKADLWSYFINSKKRAITWFKNLITLKKRQPKWRIIVDGLLLILCAILFVIIINSNAVTKLRLKHYGKVNNASKLISYINKNYNNNNKQKLVQLAIDQISVKKLNQGITYLEGLFLNNKQEAPYLKFYTLEDFNKYKIIFKSSSDVCNYFIDAQYSDEIRNQLIKLMNQYKPQEIQKDFIMRIYDLHKQGKYSDAVALAQKYQSINIGNSQNTNNIILQFNKLISIENNISSLKASLSGSQKFINTNQANIENIQSNIDSENDQVSSLKDQINQAKNDIDAEQPMTLDAYMIANIGSDGSLSKYEIAMPYYTWTSPYGYKLPSKVHAILETTTITYSSPGWFDLDVIKEGTTEVTLDNGFTQTWTVYKEATDSNADIQAKTQSISDDKASIDQINSSIKQEKGNIEKLQSRIDGMKNNELSINNNINKASAQADKTINDVNDLLISIIVS